MLEAKHRALLQQASCPPELRILPGETVASAEQRLHNELRSARSAYQEFRRWEDNLARIEPVLGAGCTRSACALVFHAVVICSLTAGLFYVPSVYALALLILALSIAGVQTYSVARRTAALYARWQQTRRDLLATRTARAALKNHAVSIDRVVHFTF